RDIGYEMETELIDTVSAYQVLFNHDKIEYQDIGTDMWSDLNYLKDGFVKDFYNEILKEKFKNSKLYNDTLKDFRVTSSGLSYHGLGFDINEVPLSKELKDYIRIKKNRGLLSEHLETDNYVNDDLFYLNNPRFIQSDVNAKEIKDGLFVSELGSPLYIRLADNTIARRITNTTDNSLYRRVDMSENNTFLNV